MLRHMDLLRGGIMPYHYKPKKGKGKKKKPGKKNRGMK